MDIDALLIMCSMLQFLITSIEEELILAGYACLVEAYHIYLAGKHVRQFIIKFKLFYYCYYHWDFFWLLIKVK